MLILAQIQPQINFLLLQMTLLYKKPLSSVDFNIGPVCYHLVRRLFEPHFLIELENTPFPSLSLIFPLCRASRPGTWNICELLPRPGRTRKLCGRLLHNCPDFMTVFCWIRWRTKQPANGIFSALQISLAILQPCWRSLMPPMLCLRATRSAASWYDCRRLLIHGQQRPIVVYLCCDKIGMFLQFRLYRAT